MFLLQHWIQEKSNELLLSVDCELIDSFLVSLRGIGIVPLYLEDIFLEDESPVNFFLWSPTSSVSRFPLLESIFFLLPGSIED